MAIEIINPELFSHRINKHHGDCYNCKVQVECDDEDTILFNQFRYVRCPICPPEYSTMIYMKPGPNPNRAKDPTARKMERWLWGEWQQED